jgi:hypothetical protein
MHYISYILDETGSMDIVREETISGFNEYKNTLKRTLKEKVNFFLTKFNAQTITLVHSGVSLAEVSDLDLKTYTPNYGTPLYDAIGKTILEVEKLATKKKDKILIVIQTDGQENSSKEFSRDQIKKMIEDRKSKKWEFVFLGADLDAATLGQSVGVAKTVSYKGTATRSMYSNLAVQTKNYVENANFDSEVDFNK